MCGRLDLSETPARWPVRFPKLLDDLDQGPWGTGLGFNVPPGTRLPVLVWNEDRSRMVAPGYFWGPYFRIQGRWKQVINAKLERLNESRLWAPAMRHGRRGVVPAAGYFEWQKTDSGSQPYYVTRKDGRPMALAALIGSAPATADGEREPTCVIVTRDPCGGIERIHRRMPVELTDAEVGQWLNPEAVIDLKDLAADDPTAAWKWWPVSRAANDPRNNGREVLEPVEL